MSDFKDFMEQRERDMLKQFVRTAQIDKVDKARAHDIISLIEVILGETENG